MNPFRLEGVCQKRRSFTLGSFVGVFWAHFQRFERLFPPWQMKENAVSMQRASTGLPSGPSRLACKENVSERIKGYYTRSKSALEVNQDCLLPPPGLTDPSEAFSLFSHLPSFSSTTHCSPLPSLHWACSAELWGQMRDKDVVKSAPEADLQLRHPGIVPSMRVILLDWMLEVRVCSVNTPAQVLSGARQLRQH